MDNKTEQLRERTKQFALRVIRLFRSLPPSSEAQTIGYQWLRCGTFVGANYRSACHSRSRVEFVARTGVVAEEADESVFWIELLGDLWHFEKRQNRASASGSSGTGRHLRGISTNSKTKVIQLATILAVMAILAI